MAPVVCRQSMKSLVNRTMALASKRRCHHHRFFFSFFSSLSLLSLCLFAKASWVGAWFFPHGFCFQFWGFFTWAVIDDSRTFSLSSHLHPSSRLLLLIFFVFLSWKCVLRSLSKTQFFFLFFSHLPLLFSFFFIFYSLSSSNIFSFMLLVDVF